MKVTQTFYNIPPGHFPTNFIPDNWNLPLPPLLITFNVFHSLEGLSYWDSPAFSKSFKCASVLLGV